MKFCTCGLILILAFFNTNIVACGEPTLDINVSKRNLDGNPIIGIKEKNLQKIIEDLTIENIPNRNSESNKTNDKNSTKNAPSIHLGGRMKKCTQMDFSITQYDGVRPATNCY
jgi:hypothetical protein